MLNELLLRFATWLGEHSSSSGLHESFYMYNWIETTHVLTLSVFLGMLFVIDLRLLGVAFTNVPASKVAERLSTPMMIGIVVMFVTGLLLYYAIPVRTTQSIWFRIKVVLLIAACVNALLLRRRMSSGPLPWDNDSVPPKPIRISAGLSLAFWACVVFTGRAIAYDWFDCGKTQAALMNWAAGCVAPADAMTADEG